MIFELEQDKYQNVKPILKGAFEDLVLDAIIEGTVSGSVWVDDKITPKTVFLWDSLEQLFFLSGENSSKVFIDSLRRLINQTILPEAKKRRHNAFNLLVSPEERWQDKIDTILMDKPYFVKKLNTYTFNPSNLTKLATWRDKLPSDYTLKQYNEKLLSHDFKNVDIINGWIRACWGSTERFMKEGAGFCIIHENTLVSWCQSDFAHGNRCELVVQTDENYRNRGFASLTASACVEHFASRNYEVNWRCYSTNVPSIRVAEKIGFEEKARRIVYRFWYDEVGVKKAE
ncbi:GNAT family N-acetyltransferase [Candidatus Bathyarchaeota archaeon]|nr:GNAT family N-acetyltransferase [Candidatus Bathyarchaeota archaeon]